MSEYTSLKIHKETHRKILDFCKKNGLLMYFFIENTLLEKIKNIEENENGNLQGNKSD